MRATRFLHLAAVVALPTLALALGGCGDRAAGPSRTVSGIQRDIPPQWQIGGSSVAPEPPAPPAEHVPNHLVAEVAPGWTPEMINDLYGTWTLDEIPGTAFALLYYTGYEYEALAAELVAIGACVTCDRNYEIQCPEAHQGSIAFYEGDLVSTDMADQLAFARVGLPAVTAYATGSGVTVAILDTGIDATHPDLAAHVVGGHDFVDGDTDPADVMDGLDQDGDGLVDEAAGHGTHVAGIIHAVAPGAALLPVRVLDSEGRGSTFGVARGIWWAMTYGADVVNLSLGFLGSSRPMTFVIETAHAQGVFFAGSAGNGGVLTAEQFPARLPQVAGVAALDSEDLKAGFSNYGNFVWLGAPGEGIVSTYLFQGYAVWSGTSMATPFVSGGAALVMGEGLAAPGAVRAALAAAAEPYDHAGLYYEGLVGAGRVDFPALVAPPPPGGQLP